LRIKWLSILLSMLILVVNIPASMGYKIKPQGGTLIAKGYELPGLIGIPESNVRFALWNGTTWMELPFWIKEETVVQTREFEANGTLTSGVVSEIYDRVSDNDLISVKVPAETGAEAKDGNWWSEALHLGLQNRFLVQFSANVGYSNLIYVYYQMRGRSLPPVYPLTQYSNSASTNGTQTTLTFSSASTQAMFEVTSLSKPQTAVLYATAGDPQVSSLDEIMLQKFEKTGWNPQPTSPFYLPSQGQAVTGVILRIDGQSYGDQYSGGTPIVRYLQVYVNDQKIWSDWDWKGKQVSQYFSFSPDITNKVQWWNEATSVMNTAKVTLTTFVGYWVVRTYIYVVYNANEHFRQAYSQYSNWYKFQNTGYGIVSFSAQLPESIANEANGARIWIHSKPYGDTYSRYLELYIDGQKMFRATIRGENTTKWDITSYLLGKNGTTVGIVITTWVGYWTVDGYIDMKYRPGVAPDTSNYWNGEIHSLTERAGNIYDGGPEAYYSMYPNTWIGIFSLDTRTKETPMWKTFDTGVTVKIPTSASSSYFVNYVEMVIKARHKYQGYIDGQNFLNLETFKGSESGAPKAQDIGSDLLRIMAAGLSAIGHPELAAVATVSSVLAKYISTGDFSYGRLADGISLSWRNWDDVNEKSILFAYDINWPYLGEYTVEVQSRIEIWYRTILGSVGAGMVSFVNTFTFFNQ